MPQPYKSRVAASRKRIKLNGRPRITIGFPFRSDHFPTNGAAQLEAHHGETSRCGGDGHLAKIELAESWHAHHVAANGRRGVRLAIPPQILPEWALSRAHRLGEPVRGA